MTLPNFLVIGAAKSGTTALYHSLKQHPQVYMSPVKEPHFFNSESGVRVFNGPTPQLPRQGVTDLNEYMALFDDVENEVAIGEASNSNIHLQACARIQQYIPDGKFICILRQPVDRAYSQFNHMRREAIEPLNGFFEAYRASSMRRDANWWPFLIYERKGWYFECLQNWFSRFRRDQIRIYLYDDWQSSPLGIVQDIFGFLNVDSSFKPDISILHNVGKLPRSHSLAVFAAQPNITKSLLKHLLPRSLRRAIKSGLESLNNTLPPPLDTELRRQITEEYRDEILKLQDLIRRDLSHWLKS